MATQPTDLRSQPPDPGCAPEDDATETLSVRGDLDMPRPGARLGDYNLTDRLGHGGMGEVFRARHERLGRFVALKVIAPRHLNDPRAAERCCQEMLALGRLDHPRLVRATDARQDGPWLYLVMDLVDGLDLAELVRRLGPLPVAAACALTAQAAEGLGYAHRQGVVHRDVKPSNLMLTSQGTAKVLDLGLARLQELSAPANESALTMTGQTIGTPDYMSPEQCVAPRTTGPPSDLYSLGCTLYHLLAGKPPFHDAKSLYEKMNAHREHPAPAIEGSRPDVPPGLSALLSRLLAKAPEDRPASADDVAEALRPYAEGADLPGLIARASTAPGQGDRTTEEDCQTPPLSPPLATEEWAAARTPTEPPGQAPAAAPTRKPADRSTRWPRDDQNSNDPPRPPDAKPTARFSRSLLRRVLTGISAVLIVVLASLALVPALQLGRLGEPGFQTFDAHLFRSQDGELLDLGLIGRDVFSAEVGDQVRVEVELSHPSYAYLLALNTDGSVQLALPESETEPPPRAGRLVLYPRKTDYFTLTEGPGVQTFAVLVSGSPLPAYRDWQVGQPALPWGRAGEQGVGAWRYEGGEFTPLVRSQPKGAGDRGKKRSLVYEPLELVCRALRERARDGSVSALAFPVKPSLGVKAGP
jgi:serine/threonine protein kinase